MRAPRRCQVKESLGDIVGRTIASVVVSEGNEVGPHTQLLLVFNDGSCYELYGEIHGTGGLVEGDHEWAKEYAGRLNGLITDFTKPSA